MYKTYTYKQLEAFIGRYVMFSDGHKEPYLATVTKVTQKAFTVTKFRRYIQRKYGREYIKYNTVGVSYPIGGEYSITPHETGQPILTRSS